MDSSSPFSTEPMIFGRKSMFPKKKIHGQVAPGNVKLHFSQRQGGGGTPGAASGAALHSARCCVMPWRLRRKVRLQLGQKKAIAKWSDTSTSTTINDMCQSFRSLNLLIGGEELPRISLTFLLSGQIGEKQTKCHSCFYRK